MHSIGYAVWPELSVAFGAGDIPLARRLHRVAVHWSVWVGLAACLAIAIAAPFILPIWTSNRIHVQYALLVALLAVVLLRITWETSAIVSVSWNKHQRIATMYVLTTLASVLLASATISQLGLVGAAASLALADLVLSCFVIRKSLRLVDDSFSSFVGSVLRLPQPFGWHREAAIVDVSS
jgi:O-antigen/teichoic acid export membrane protein